MLIPHRPALIINSSLREYGAEFALASTGGLTRRSPCAACGLGLHHKHLRPIHLYVKIWNRRASSDREMEVFGTLNIFLLPAFNVCSDGFGRTLDRFRWLWP
jgi:hypothetical protein